MGCQGGTTLEGRARAFAKKGKEDSIWALNNILKFVQFQKDCVDKKEITGATLRNYVKSIKLFCEMADMPIPWKKITRGLPKGKKYADDRIPTVEEIRKVVEYPDRRIKAIVCTDGILGNSYWSMGLSAMGAYKANQRSNEIVAQR